MTALKVTLSSASVTLANDTGTLTVSVTNTGTTLERVVLGAYPPLAAAAPVAAGGPAPTAPIGSAADWTEVEHPLREIAGGATEQYVVSFNGKGAAAGTYQVRLIAYSANRAPEEFSDQAGIVTVSKATTAATVIPRKPPWWLIAAGIGLVVIIAGVAFVLFSGNGTPTATTTTTTTGPTSNGCKPGLVPRLARPSDKVCVSKASAAQVIFDNNPDVQVSRKPNPPDPNGLYGINTCLQGYVWRDAFQGDQVCVDGATRDRAAQENANAAANAAQ